MLHMDRIGVRDLRQNASRYLARVRAGETIEVTDRGTPVALIVPAKRPPIRDQLVAEGRLLPPRSDGDLLDLEPLVLPPGESRPSDVVARMRDE